VIIWRFFRSSHFGRSSFFWQSQIFKIGLISLVKSFGKFGSGSFVKIRFVGKIGFSASKVFVSQAFWQVVFVFGNCQKLSYV